MQKRGEKPKPLGIMLLAAFVYVVGVITLVRGLIFMGTLTLGLFNSPSWAAGNEMFLGIFWIIISILIMIVGAGLWYLKKQAWIATIIFSAVMLAVSAAGLPATWLTFGLYLILLLYLITVREHFRI